MDVPEGFALRPTTASDVPALTRAAVVCGRRRRGSGGLNTAVPARGLRRMHARRGFAEGDVVQWPGEVHRSVVVMVRDLP